MGDIAESEGVGLGIGAAFQQVGIAGILTLGEEGAAHPPDRRVEPVQDAGNLGEKGHPEVATLDVAEFVEKGHAESRGGPLAGAFGKVNGGSKQSGDDGGLELGVKVEVDGTGDAELGEGFGEDGRGHGGNGLLTPASHG